MIENQAVQPGSKADYRDQVNRMGKKEFTLLKMQEYGFWPQDWPTPYERQKNETREQYAYRQNLLREYEKIGDQIAKLYADNEAINGKLRELSKAFDATWDYEKIRQDVAQKIMAESIARRAARKQQRESEQAQRSAAWQEKKAGQIVFIGRGYSAGLQDIEVDAAKLAVYGFPVLKTDRELAELLGLEYRELRFLAYHRDVVVQDHYHRYTIPKRKGGLRNIAAPKSRLKKAQSKILEAILSHYPISESAHGFVKERSIITGAERHAGQPELVINLDLENFFPSITFERVRGMFKGFGYSGYIASLLAMVCTYCERMPIEVRGQVKYVTTSARILPQGSPASPMITNILCVRLDRRLSGLAAQGGFVYTRYADDLSFSFKAAGELDAGKLLGLIAKIVTEEGFTINRAKTRFLRPNNRQTITGIVVNHATLGVSRQWVKRFRAAVYNANRQKQSGSLAPETKSEIAGMASWLKNVNEEKYRPLIAAALDVIK